MSPAPFARRPNLPREIWVLAGAALLIALGFGLVTPVLPQFAQSFNVSVAAASFVVSAFALTRLLFAPAGGALIARLGERRIYMSGLIIVAVSSVATAFAQDYVQLVIFRDRKSTRLNSSHVATSYAVFCLQKNMFTIAIHHEQVL